MSKENSMTAELVKQPRRVRAGPPPSTDRAEMRAGMKHGPYSYGAPPNSARMPLEDMAEERLQSRLKATEQDYVPAVRPIFVWAIGLATFFGALYLFFRS